MTTSDLQNGGPPVGDFDHWPDDPEGVNGAACDIRATWSGLGGPTNGDDPGPGEHTSGNDGWPDPELFDVLDLPIFPIDTLTPWLRDWSQAEATFAQVPLDLPAGIGLASVSLAVARRFHVGVRPGWLEPTNVWIVAALPPGERKSAIFDHATRPAFDFAKAEAERLAPEVAAREFDRSVLEGQAAEARSAAIKGKTYGGGNARRAALEIADRLDDLEKIVVPTLLADDVSAEALAVLLSDNDERLGVFSAEGGPFELMAGRYSDKGGNFEIYLKAHSGDHHIVHRIKRDPIQLDHPLLTMAVTVQPTVIQGLANNDGFRGRGLLARFFYMLPQTALGQRATDTPAVPPSVAEAYALALRNIFEIRTNGRILAMSEGADRARAAFQTALEPRLGPDGDLSHVGDWAGKLTGLVCRVAGVLHVADHAMDPEKMPGEIPLVTFARATAIGEFALEHARAAFGSMGADEDAELAKRVWKWVVRKNVETFTEYQAKRAVHASPEAAKVAIVKLVERNLVRKRPPPPPGIGRPSSDTYDVNPRTRT